MIEYDNEFIGQDDSYLTRSRAIQQAKQKAYKTFFEAIRNAASNRPLQRMQSQQFLHSQMTVAPIAGCTEGQWLSGGSQLMRGGW
jgi:hypothetical protein